MESSPTACYVHAVPASHLGGRSNEVILSENLFGIIQVLKKSGSGKRLETGVLIPP